MDLPSLYAILVDVARNRQQITYGDLSRRYHERTGDWHEPHGSWDAPLGEINVATHGVGLPPLSAVVVLQDTREPGGLFWGSSPGVPTRPRGDVARMSAYVQILASVHNATWPETMP